MCKSKVMDTGSWVATEAYLGGGLGWPSPKFLEMAIPGHPTKI